MSNLEKLMEEIDDRVETLLFVPDTEEMNVWRYIDLADDNYIEVRSINRNGDPLLGRDYDGFYLNGVTAPDYYENPDAYDMLQSCPHGPVFSFIKDVEGEVCHGLCVIEPGLLASFPDLDAPGLGNLAETLGDLASTIETEMVWGRQSYTIASDSAEVARFHESVQALLAEGTVHTRKTRNFRIPIDRLLHVETNGLSDDNLPVNIRRSHDMEFKPLIAALHEGDNVLFYRHMPGGEKETVVEPEDVFERQKGFTHNVHRDEEGKVIAWNTDVKGLEAYQQSERERGMYEPTHANLETVLAALVQVETI